MVLANGALALMSYASATEEQFLELGLARAVPREHRASSSSASTSGSASSRRRCSRSCKAQGADREGAGRARCCKHNWREVVLTALLRTGQQVPFYIFTTYIITYAHAAARLQPRHDPELRDDPGADLDGARSRSAATCPTCIGRRRITAIGCVVMMVFPFIYFAMLDTRVVGAGVPGDRVGAAAARPAVRAAGGVHRRELSRLAALQRVVARLSARVDHRRRPGAASSRCISTRRSARRWPLPPTSRSPDS